MKPIFIAVAIVLTVYFSVNAQSETPELKLLFVEIQTGTTDSASSEFVEIANGSADIVDLSGIVMQYQSSTGTSWLNKCELSGRLAPYSRLLLSSDPQRDGNFTFNSGLASGGGHLRLFQPQNELELDRITWGAAENSLFSASEAPQADQSLKRFLDEDGYFIDTDNDATDWFISDTPTAHGDLVWPEAETSPPSDTPAQTDDSEKASPKNEPTTDPTINRPKLQLTEIMPDPLPPLSDLRDEYIEIFNPNSFAVSLSGYILEAGNDYRYSFSLPEAELAPGNYLALARSTTSLTLSNGGSQVRLADINGNVYDETVYPKAEPGQSWSKAGGSWQWTAPTPNALNQTGEANGEDESGEVLAAGGDYSLSQGSADGGIERDPETTYNPPAEAEIEPINYSVLAGVGSLALLYVVYEYRQDIGNRIAQARRYVSNWKKHRGSASGRRGVGVGKRRWRWKNRLCAWFSRRPQQS